MSRIRLTENVTPETTPPANQVAVFPKTDKELWIKRDDGTEDQLLTVTGGSGAFVATDGSSTMTGHLDMGNQDIDDANLVNATSGLKAQSATYKGEFDSQNAKLTVGTTVRSHLSLGRLDLWDTPGTGQLTARVDTGDTFIDVSGDLTLNPIGDMLFTNKKLKGVTAGTASNEATVVGQFVQSGIRFVSTSGSDLSGTGSIAAPFQTITAAIVGAPAGTVIYIYPGTYTEPTISIPNEIKFQGYGAGVTVVPNGFTCTPTGAGVYVDFTNINYGSFYLDAVGVVSGLIGFQRTTGTILRQDNNQSVLLQMVESTLAGGSVLGGTNIFDEVLVIVSPTFEDGVSVFENSKFVARIEAEGPTIIRMLDCELFGASEFINGTIVAGNTPTWQADLATDYLGGYTGSVTKVLLATVPASSTTGFATVATSGSYIDLSSTPMTSTGQMSTSLETAVVALTDGPTIALDASAGNTFTVTLAGNRLLDTPTNSSDGQKIVIKITQDLTGSRLLSYTSAWNFGVDLVGLSLSTIPGATDYLGAIYNAASSKWDVISIVRGY